MEGFIIKTPAGKVIRFAYHQEAALTADAFEESLPFSVMLYHARVSGYEVWTDMAPRLAIQQENSSVFALPGEIAIGPMLPARNRITGCLGIFYGEGQLLDCGNIFGKVHEEDMDLLKALGHDIWQQGGQLISFEKYVKVPGN